ncbi:MAG: hypothetical protein A2Z73_04245 [Deltaproteobacteria bacterium RBG_13_60_28]|nr:MAG: hypothetical protein A2Z73_04245 [Deltaproteobacteria bacterium RBG_13_60_28]
MGLWMKCPKCQTPNPLFLKACAGCGFSLEKLPLKQRVYVLTPPGAAPEKTSRLLTATPTPESPLPATTPEAAAAPKGAKAPRKPRKKNQ